MEASGEEAVEGQAGDPQAAYLPDAVIRQIATNLVGEESPGSTLIHLLSMCGVCKQWRRIAREVNPGSCMGFDGMDNTFPTNAAMQRFRRLTLQQKEALFLAGADLLTGYAQVVFAGEAVNDALLMKVASRSQGQLLKVRVSQSTLVTDAGLSALIAAAPQLQELTLEELSRKVTGRFVPFMLEACTSLRELKVQSVPQINWTHSSAWASGSLQRDLVMRKLHVRGANLNADFAALLAKMPGLTELEVDGPPDNVDAASTACSLLTRICYQVSDRLQLDDALAAFVSAKALSTLELVVKNFTLSTEQLRSIGMLPLTELRLDSFIYKQQPTLSRSSYSHVDNEGVKGLVDSVCSRWSTGGASSAGGGSASGILAAADMKPLKLSLCGATALTHDAVSALLRLPILTELDIGGCCRITAMDKMRLVAKVRAGREMLDAAVATTRPGGGSGSGTSAASRAASMRNMMRFPAPLAFA